MRRSALALAALSAPVALASPLKQRWTESSADCVEFMAPIHAEAQTLNMSAVLGVPANQQQWIDIYQRSMTLGAPLSAQLSTAPVINLSEDFNIYFQYCKPKDQDPTRIFMATHGVAGNAGYWDVRVDGKTDYSFVESATAKGWATLSWDRLGVGRSDHPSGLDVIQMSTHESMMVEVATKLRQGGFDNIPAFDKIISIGHSYGSALTNIVSLYNPDLWDAIVLTGFSANISTGGLGIASFDAHIANDAYPDRFGDLDNTHLITVDQSADQKSFFHYGGYTQEAIDAFTATKGEYAIGEVVGFQGPRDPPTAPYTNPVLVITGNEDGAFCTANCNITSLGEGMTQLDTVRVAYPQVPEGDFKTVVVPETGHGMNFHTSAYDWYQQVLDFANEKIPA